MGVEGVGEGWGAPLGLDLDARVARRRLDATVIVNQVLRFGLRIDSGSWRARRDLGISDLSLGTSNQNGPPRRGRTRGEGSGLSAAAPTRTSLVPKRGAYLRSVRDVPRSEPAAPRRGDERGV